MNWARGVNWWQLPEFYLAFIWVVSWWYRSASWALFASFAPLTSTGLFARSFLSAFSKMLFFSPFRICAASLAFPAWATRPLAAGPCLFAFPFFGTLLQFSYLSSFVQLFGGLCSSASPPAVSFDALWYPFPLAFFDSLLSSSIQWADFLGLLGRWKGWSSKKNVKRYLIVWLLSSNVQGTLFLIWILFFSLLF